MSKWMWCVISVMAVVAVFSGRVIGAQNVNQEPYQTPIMPHERFDPGEARNIIPMPYSQKGLDQPTYFKVQRAITTVCVADPSNPKLMALADYLATRLNLKVVTKPQQNNYILLEIMPGFGNYIPGGYRLEISPKAVTISGYDSAGVMYGIQTFLQLAPPECYAGGNTTFFTIRSSVIEDRPAYLYRGMHLDVSRHFFTVDEVKRFLDLMVMHKLNKFHWHLTDDQGWRLEIKQYPNLTKTGATRRESPKEWKRGEGDGKAYGPYFYTQEQVRDVIAYADLRGIEVIPEIELPGHAMAALAAYPELGCTGGPYETWCQWGVADTVFCAGNDKTLEFLKNVLGEVCELFPSKYVHIGGDECPKVEWKKCPKCQARMKQHRLRNENELQSWFVSEMGRYLSSKNKKMIGWDEILEGGIPKDAIIMSWRGVSGGIQAAYQRHPVIMTPTSHFYLNYAESKVPDEPETIGGFVPLEQVYNFDLNTCVPPKFMPYMLGAQGNCWSEYFQNFQQVEYSILPRMAAVAELTWAAPRVKPLVPEISKDDVSQPYPPPMRRDYIAKNFSAFEQRLIPYYIRYQGLGANFRFTNVLMPDELAFQDTCEVVFPYPKYEGAKLCYVFNDDDKTVHVYNTPIVVSEPKKITYWLQLQDGTMSKKRDIQLKKTPPRKGVTPPQKQIKGLERHVVFGNFDSCDGVIKAMLKEHHVDHADLSIHGEKFPANHYGIVYKGLFRAPQNGRYTFHMRSDDGAKLFFGNDCVIDHDGLHGANERKSASLFFETGWHRFSVVWFDAGGDKTLHITVQRDGEPERDLLKDDFILETTQEP